MIVKTLEFGEIKSALCNGEINSRIIFLILDCRWLEMLNVNVECRVVEEMRI